MLMCRSDSSWRRRQRAGGVRRVRWRIDWNQLVCWDYERTSVDSERIDRPCLHSRGNRLDQAPYPVVKHVKIHDHLLELEHRRRKFSPQGLGRVDSAAVQVHDLLQNEDDGFTIKVYSMDIFLVACTSSPSSEIDSTKVKDLGCILKERLENSTGNATSCVVGQYSTKVDESI